MTRAALIARVRARIGAPEEVVKQYAQLWQQPERWVRERFTEAHVRLLVERIGGSND